MGDEVDDDPTFPRDGKVVFDWTPTEADRVTRFDDLAERYVVQEVKGAHGGIIVCARYRGEWVANPWCVRAVVRHLLNDRNRLRDAVGAYVSHMIEAARAPESDKEKYRAAGVEVFSRMMDAAYGVPGPADPAVRSDAAKTKSDETEVQR